MEIRTCGSSSLHKYSLFPCAPILLAHELACACFLAPRSVSGDGNPPHHRRTAALLSSGILENTMRKYPGIKQYQDIQFTTSYL